MINIKKGLFVAILTVMFVPSLSFAAFDNSLRYGSKGQDVQELQEFLVEQGYLNHEPTGSFYALTLKAVKAFQLANGLPSTGYWGVMSRAKANELISLETSVEAEQAEVPVVIQPATVPAPIAPTVSPVVFGQTTQVEPTPVVQNTQNNVIITPMDLSEITFKTKQLPTKEEPNLYVEIDVKNNAGKLISKPVVNIELSLNGKVIEKVITEGLNRPYGFSSLTPEDPFSAKYYYTVKKAGTYTLTLKAQGKETAETFVF